MSSCWLLSWQSLTTNKVTNACLVCHQCKLSQEGSLVDQVFLSCQLEKRNWNLQINFVVLAVIWSPYTFIALPLYYNTTKLRLKSSMNLAILATVLELTLPCGLFVIRLLKNQLIQIKLLNAEPGPCWTSSGLSKRTHWEFSWPSTELEYFTFTLF